MGEGEPAPCGRGAGRDNALMSLAALADLAAPYDAWLREAALPLWAGDGYDAVAGGFREALDEAGRPVAGPVRLRVQARQTWVYARASLIGWDGPWRERVAGGLQALLTRYHREAGGFRAAATHDGRIADDRVALYDQAFVLLAFAGATAAGEPPEGLAAAARELFEETIAPLRHAAGGFREPVGDHPFQANAHMHLLEAALAWTPLDPRGPWAALADEIVALTLARFVDGDRLREFFDGAWAPAPGRDGRRVEPGHQFEWAWLLESWALARGDALAREIAAALFATGERGVDRRRKVAVDALSDDLTVLEPTARLWPQTERLRAAVALAARGDAQAETYLAAAREAAQALWRYLSPVGSWRDRMDGAGGLPLGPAPASSLYHITGAILALTGRDAT
jgi:mannose/cellobiose epimerase-like protein (N-acyl-D-glucosamine 2-epimerase family)